VVVGSGRCMAVPGGSAAVGRNFSTLPLGRLRALRIDGLASGENLPWLPAGDRWKPSSGSGRRVGEIQLKPRLAIIPGRFWKHRLGVAHPQQAEAMGRGSLLHSARWPCRQRCSKASRPAALRPGPPADPSPAAPCRRESRWPAVPPRSDRPAAPPGHLLQAGAGVAAAAARPLEGGEVVLARASLQGAAIRVSSRRTDSGASTRARETGWAAGRCRSCSDSADRWPRSRRASDRPPGRLPHPQRRGSGR
jgi:hypothetical protein